MGNKFDLDAARKHADTGGLMNTTKWLHAALDEIERLRNLNRDLEARLGNEQVATMQDREAQLQKFISSLTARNKELEDALVEVRARTFPVWMINPLVARDVARQQLQAEGKIGPIPEMQDRIVQGLDLCHEEVKRKIAGPDKGLLTAEQREALEYAANRLGLNHSPDPDAHADQHVAGLLRDLLSGKQTWEATEERIDGLLAMIGMLNTEVYDKAGPLFEEKNRLVRMLLAMLEEAGK